MTRPDPIDPYDPLTEALADVVELHAPVAPDMMPCEQCGRLVEASLIGLIDHEC